MKKLLIIFGSVAAVALLTLLAVSCSKESVKEITTPPAVETTTLVVPALRADGDATVDELRINSVRLLIFRSESISYNGAGVLAVNSYKTGNQSFEESKVPVGKIDIFVVVNEYTNTLSPWKNILDSPNLTEADVKNLAKTWTDALGTTNALPSVNASNPIPMFKSYLGVDLDDQGNMTYNGAPLTTLSVERIFAKVIVNINFDNGGNAVTINSLDVNYVPTVSWLSPTTNNNTSESGFFSVTGIGTAPGTSLTIDPAENLNSGKPNRKYVFYLPEYILVAPSLHTFLVLNAASKAFSIALGDGMGMHDNDYMNSSSATTSDLRISRNTCYIINITSITGEIAISFTVSVNAWGDPTPVPVH